MATMSNYCKAYPVARFESFPGWQPRVPPLVASDSEPAEEAGPTDASQDREAVGAEPERYYYLHDNYTVTAGIFVDEHVAYDAVTPEWKAFCDQQLEFAVPADALE